MRADSTIAITKKTKEKLITLKRYDRETFDDIINRILDIMDEKQEKQQRLDYP